MPKLYTRKRAFRKPILFQSNPKLGHPKDHGFQWTTIHGHNAHSRKLVGQILDNQRTIGSPYQYTGTIKATKELAVSEIKTLWGQISRAMRQAGVIAFWIIEVALTNKVDWHFVIRECPAELMKSNARRLKSIIRQKAGQPLNMQFGPFEKTPRVWINYICKARVKGIKPQKPLDSDSVDDVAAETIINADDYYQRKRVLFRPKTGLNKYGTIGPFWATKKAERTKQYKERKAKRERTINIVDTAAKRLADITGLHETYVLRKLAEEWEANPDDKELKRQNDQLHNDWCKEEYADEYEAIKAFEERYSAPFSTEPLAA